jgi:hypothetical protein
MLKPCPRLADRVIEAAAAWVAATPNDTFRSPQAIKARVNLELALESYRKARGTKEEFYSGGVVITQTWATDRHSWNY